MEQTFFHSWSHYMESAGSAFIVIGFLIFLYHEVKILQQKEYKARYDYVNLHEIQFFWYSILAFIVAGTFFGNTIDTEKIVRAHNSMLYFWVRIFLTISCGLMAYLVLNTIVRIYYPKQIEKRLTKLRNTVRFSPAGNPMRKLSEEEEDAYLDASQIAEEASAIHSVDYDVWIDEKTGYKTIEKYMNYQHSEECPNCGYTTLKIENEEVEKAPTTTETGILVKHYRCGYCRHRELKRVTLGKLMETPV